MTKRKTGTTERTLPKAAKVQNYKLALKQKRISGTIRPDDPSFDETASYPSISTLNEYDVPRPLVATEPAKKFPMSLKGLGIAISIFLIIAGAIYKFALLEKSVEFINKGLTEIQNRMSKVEEEHKKDYQHLNEKLTDHLLKNYK